VAAALGLWLFASNRWLLHWSDPGLKSSSMAGLVVFLVVSGLVAANRLKPAQWLFLPVATICAFSIGEARRAWLRYSYSTNDNVIAGRPRPDWLHPITTTDLVVNHIEVKADIPLERLRVVQLTDLHVTSGFEPGYYARVLAATRAEAPDLIVMTGDYLSRPEYLSVLQRWLTTPLSARYGVYATLGNHEAWIHIEDTVRALLRGAHYEVLSGRCLRVVDVGEGAVILCGTERPWGPDFPQPDRGPKDYVIALSHTPDNVYALHGRANAVFSGHNHGGQFRLPGIGAFAVPSRYGRRFDQGHFDVDGTELFVSAGLGADFPPVRLYCPPELLVVDFVRRR
jgi:predicted MPP superfamily phosphohydrolase